MSGAKCESKTRMDGKTVIVTGGSSGIGLEAAKHLANKGARVIIASRNQTKLRIAREEIVEGTGNKEVVYKELDLSSLKSVRNFANDINAGGRLDVLINNAGSVALPDVATSDGLNLTMQVNFFGAFLLTFLLLPKLKATSGRVINSSAASMYLGEVDFDHWNEIGRYSILTSLANSKLAMVLFNAELSRRLEDGTANTYDPFVVKNTDILTNLPGFFKEFTRFFVNIIGQEKENVGKQVAYLASASEMANRTGEHHKFCAKFFNHWLVSDSELTKRVWEESKRLVKITEEEDWER